MTRASPSLGLRFDDVALRLGDHEILEGVSFSVGPGEVVGLLGRNGAGKTSLLRIATRQLRPDRGRVLLGGRPVAELSRRTLARRVASVAQDMHVPFPFLAGELVLMGRTPHQGLFGFESADDVAIARAAMARVGIESLADRPVDQLSGGERQLVLFARALAQAPQWLLLDEPTAFLDLRHRLDVLRVLRSFALGGGGVLVVSHDIGLVARACDRIVVLSEGVVLAEGPPREILTQELIQTGFGIAADIIEAPDGGPLVVPHIAP